jgi:hypothetical protein
MRITQTYSFITSSIHVEKAIQLNDSTQKTTQIDSIMSADKTVPKGGKICVTGVFIIYFPLM